MSPGTHRPLLHLRRMRLVPLLHRRRRVRPRIGWRHGGHRPRINTTPADIHPTTLRSLRRVCPPISIILNRILFPGTFLRLLRKGHRILSLIRNRIPRLVQWRVWILLRGFCRLDAFLDRTRACWTRGFPTSFNGVALFSRLYLHNVLKAFDMEQEFERPRRVLLRSLP